MTTNEARIHALNARALALSAEVLMMQSHDQHAVVRGTGPYDEALYKQCVDALYAVENDIHAVIVEGYL
jgi:hypothetical protein